MPSSATSEDRIVIEGPDGSIRSIIPDASEISPLHEQVIGVLSKCAPSFWGNLIFNIGMAGVCAMLGIATGPGGVVCTMALIGANLGIDWDKPC